MILPDSTPQQQAAAILVIKLSDLVHNVSWRTWLLTSGRAVAQAVSHWVPTVAARVRVRAACGVCGGQSSTGAGFLRVLWFPLPIIPPTSHHHNHPELAQ
jgi:hypothetical protein